MLGPELELNLSISEQSLTTLSFANPNPNAIKGWVEDLPMANIGETSRQLYQAIAELNKLVCSAQDRLAILESIREPIHYVCTELSKHFLNQSVTLPEKQRKIVNLANALQVHLANGYKAVMMDCVAQMSNEKVRKNFACAAHRMTTEYGKVLLRAYQLYNMPPKDVWKELHEVYQFSEGAGLFKYAIQDNQNQHLQETRIDQAYKRNLLLSCCRPNQLRQSDIATAYEVFEVWSDYVEVGASYSSASVFVINMEQDLPPRYRSLLHDELSDMYYGFDTAELVSRLTNHLSALTQKKDDGVVHLSIPRPLNDITINHLNHAFGILTKRTFKRIASSSTIQLCAGLSASHYYSSGEVEFHVQMLNKAQTGGGDNIFMSQSRQKSDAWADAHDATGASAQSPADTPISFNRPVGKKDQDAYPKHTVPLVNTSPGGYCLQWNDSVPSNIQAGEILSVREEDDQPWSIAVIRWIRHAKQKGTQIGIELLAPHARPCGVQLLHKTGAPSEYLRGLLLPEISSIGQPTTLITPRVPFQSGSKVSVRINEMESKCQLEQRVAVTASFSQFELSQKLNIQDQTTPKTGTETDTQDTEDDFDSLWPSL